MSCDRSGQGPPITARRRDASAGRSSSPRMVAALCSLPRLSRREANPPANGRFLWTEEPVRVGRGTMNVRVHVAVRFHRSEFFVTRTSRRAFGAVNQTLIPRGDSETHTLKGPSDATWAKPTGSPGRASESSLPASIGQFWQVHAAAPLTRSTESSSSDYLARQTEVEPICFWLTPVRPQSPIPCVSGIAAASG